MTRAILFAVALTSGCGATAAEPAGDPSNDTSNDTSTNVTTSAPTAACPWRSYAPSSGCYVDDSDPSNTLTVADADALARLIRPYPAEANRPPCDPAGEAARFDFAASRIFIVLVRDAGGGVPPEPVRVECARDVTRVVVLVDMDCGGAERGPGRMMVVVPAGATPVELVNEGRTDCPSYGGGAPPA